MKGRRRIREETGGRGWAVRLALLSCLLGTPGAAGGKDRPNVLLITVDTFRPDHVSAYGYARETSPALDRIAADGVLFEEAISSSSWTSPGLLSVLTGQYAPTHGVDVRGKSLDPGTPTLATELRKAGYAVPDILYLSSIPNFRNLGLTESYEERDRYLPQGDEVLFRALEAYRDSTFFLYYHYRNLHLPFDPDPPYDEMYTPEDFGAGLDRQRVETVRENVTIPVGSATLEASDSSWVRGLYDGQIRQMDEELFARLERTLRRLGLYENTLVIVTADHGEELLDHGWIGHPSTSFKGSAYDELLRIPLVMTCPSRLPPGRRVSMQVQNVDILPTVLDLLDLPVPETVQGRSVLSAVRGRGMEPRPAFTETSPGGYQATPEMLKTRVRAMRTPEWKLIHTHGPGQDRYELYDLTEDPEERENVADAHPGVVSRMRKELHAWLLSSRREGRRAESGAARHEGPLRVLNPEDGDTLRFREAGMTVAVRWTGVEGASYVIEYDVGEGDYALEGELPQTGTEAVHGPFTEEMWNMLALYNPFAFRVRAADGPRASPWVRFRIEPSGAAGPSWWTAVRAGAAFWWREGRLLAGGLGRAALGLLSRADGVSASTVLSYGLMCAIAAAALQPALSRLGPDRVKAWGLAAAYTGFIYATLPVMPDVWRALYRETQGRIDYGGTLTVLVAAGALAAFLWRRCRRPAGLLPVPVLAAAYVWMLLNLGSSPAERFHLAEYGLLSCLLFRAFRVDAAAVPALAAGWLLASGLGFVDEAIQWMLPNRVFEWKDVGLNAASAGLGTALLATVRAATQAEDGA